MLRICMAIIVAMYKKSLVLSLKERHARGGPGIANLVGIDAQHLQDLLTYVHAVWYFIFQIGLAIYVLFGQVGPSCLLGLIIIHMMIPTTNFVARFKGQIQKTLLVACNARMLLNGKVLGAMKMIKIQAWEENFRARLLGLHNAELDQLWRYFLTLGILVTIYSSALLLATLTTFCAYTVFGKTLDVAMALTALALFDIICFPMIMHLQIVNAYGNFS
jgi:ATP-binding cassette subfamily C (CFTR/MRP) protein 1